MFRRSICARANLLVLSDSAQVRRLDAFDSICPHWLKICLSQPSDSELMLPLEDEARAPQQQPQMVVSFRGNGCGAMEYSWEQSASHIIGLQRHPRAGSWLPWPGSLAVAPVHHVSR